MAFVCYLCGILSSHISVYCLRKVSNCLNFSFFLLHMYSNLFTNCTVDLSSNETNNILKSILLFYRLFYERKFDFLPQEANNVNSMVYLLSAALSPFFGILIDKTGRNMTWVIISIVTTISAHFMLAFTFFNPYIGVVRKSYYCLEC